MAAIRFDGEFIDAYTICLAHNQLESDFNEGGWLRERPSNQRRMASTGVQLSRMKFDPRGDWVDITADPADDCDGHEESVRLIYCSNVLKWDLPINAELANTIRRQFAEDALRPYQERLEIAINNGYWPEQKRAPLPVPF